MDISDLVGKRIVNIWLRPFDSKESTYEYILIEMEDVSLKLNVNRETDELILKILDYNHQMDNSNLLNNDLCKKFIGHKIIGLWTSLNHNGYFDVFMIGTVEFKPNVIFTSIASQIIINFVD